ncbi:MAG: DNA polymerase-3 subunit epsilon [Crocinitomix sp.]|jgi:DNA polymerase-3 subunit epsilon
MNFTAIDFETATAKRDSACAIGLVKVENGRIVDEYSALIKPPNNEYNWHNTNVHGITAYETRNSPNFAALFAEIEGRINGQTLVAHNASFDRSVLQKTMLSFGLNYEQLNLNWECTLKIYKSKGYSPAKLNVCCQRHGIPLNHHDALSDAKACAQLYLIR